MGTMKTKNLINKNIRLKLHWDWVSWSNSKQKHQTIFF